MNTDSTKSPHARTIEDPYYIAVCDVCGGINGAWSCSASDSREIVEGWQADGRKTGWMTIPPRLSCTCPTPGIPSLRDEVKRMRAEIERLTAELNTLRPMVGRVYTLTDEAMKEIEGAS